jgi:hypothetical protein
VRVRERENERKGEDENKDVEGGIKQDETS